MACFESRSTGLRSSFIQVLKELMRRPDVEVIGSPGREPEKSSAEGHRQFSAKPEREEVAIGFTGPTPVRASKSASRTALLGSVRYKWIVPVVMRAFQFISKTVIGPQPVPAGTTSAEQRVSWSGIPRLWLTQFGPLRFSLGLRPLEAR